MHRVLQVFFLSTGTQDGKNSDRIRIACKSDMAGLLKTWFSVKNFTEKSRLFYHFNSLKIGLIHTPTACLLKKLISLSICIHNRQSNSAAYVKAIMDVKKSAKATADVKPLKIKKRPKSSWHFAIFQWSSLLKITFLVAQPCQIYRLWNSYPKWTLTTTF